MFRRVKALMMEPADYAIYLAFAYAIVDRFGPRFIGGVARGILKGLILVFLATTVSLSGVLLLLAYFGTRSLVAVGRGRWSRPAFARSLVVVPPLILGFALFLRSDAAEPGLVFLQRASRAVEVVQSGVLTGSEGSRANALPVLGAYWSGGGVSRVIWGEGYANHEAWLVREYGDLGEFSSFAQGQINNVMAVLGIATGAVGLVMYLLFCGRIAFQRDRGLPVAVLAIWLVANMASGMLVGYLLWSLVLVVRVLEAAPYPYPSRGGAAA